jgi:hypothetical protein
MSAESGAAAAAALSRRVKPLSVLRGQINVLQGCVYSALLPLDEQPAWSDGLDAERALSLPAQPTHRALVLLQQRLEALEALAVVLLRVARVSITVQQR